MTEPSRVRTNNVVAKKCAFFTDVEGNLDYFKRYVQMSRVLKFDPPDVLDFQDNDTMFVYGGDSQDKGVGDIRFVRMLLDFKKKYAERVHFIIGNRDGNKIRLCSELNTDNNNARLFDTKVMNDREWQYWIEESKRVTPQEFLNKDPNNILENTWTNRLKWLLKETMGAEGAFERRKEELKILHPDKEIQDDDVVQSYREECDPKAPEDKNFMWQYLRHAKMAHVFASTIFVHGGLNSQNIGTVPGTTIIDTNALIWIHQLNYWTQKQLDEFERNPKSLDSGKLLKDYGSSENGNKGCTVQYSHYLEKGNSKHISQKVQTFMARNKISGVLSGHQPHGDCPNVIITGCSTIITADTSYSQIGAKTTVNNLTYVDNRGQNSVCEVIAYRDGTYFVHGTLADGKPIEYTLGGPDGDPYVGRQLTKDNSWIKAKIKDQEEYVTFLGQGFKCNVSTITTEELKKYSDTDFVQPDIPYRDLQALYRIVTPKLDTKDEPRENTDNENSVNGDTIEEYWCDKKFRTHTFNAKTKQKEITMTNTQTPIPIPNEIKDAKWDFNKKDDYFKWVQVGDWGIYLQEYLQMKLAELFEKLKHLTY
jgi:hypothetical protein